MTRLILLLGVGGVALAAGQFTAHRGDGPAGPYSGIGIQSGPLTFYRADAGGQRWTGLGVQSGPFTRYLGDDGSSGVRIESGPLTTYRWQYRCWDFDATRKSAGNPAYYAGRFNSRYAATPDETFTGTRQRVGNTSVYREY